MYDIRKTPLSVSSIPTTLSYEMYVALFGICCCTRCKLLRERRREEKERLPTHTFTFHSHQHLSSQQLIVVNLLLHREQPIQHPQLTIIIQKRSTLYYE